MPRNRALPGRRDFDFQDFGSVTVLTARTKAARRWRSDHLPSDAQNWGRDGVVIEPRYVGPIIEGIADAGLTVVSL